MEKRVIDKRKKEKFMIDDEYLNGMAKLCGINATGVYMALCRHSDQGQVCFPSNKLISEKLGISVRTVISAIKKLKERKVIEIYKSRTKKGNWLNNTYLLLDKSEWNYTQVQDMHMDTQVQILHDPSANIAHTQVQDMHIKETHSKETHNSIISSEQSSQVKESDGINKIFEVFYKINPTINWGNETSRKAAADLIQRFSLDETIRMAESIISVQGKPYAPVATTPYQMKEKLAQFKIYFQNLKNNQPKFIQL